MGFRLTPLRENYVMLSYDNDYWISPVTFYDTNSLEEAMEYFGLYLDENNELRRKDLNKVFLDRYGLNVDTSEIFLTQLESLGNSLSEEMAIDNEFIFLSWMPGKYYNIGNRVYCPDGIYECIQPHMAHKGGPPWELSKFWKQLYHEDKIETWYPNSNYAEGDKVNYLDTIWQSTIDGNNDTPGETNAWVFNQI